MDRLIAPNSVPVGGAATAPVSGTPQYATDGNPGAGIAPTTFPAYAWNAVQEELIAVLADAGVAPDRTANSQVVQALRAMRRAQAFISTGSFVVPANVTKIKARVFGGGGGGGAAANTSSSAAGGGAGGYCEGLINVTPGATLAITVGTGGVGAATTATATGGSGGSTSVGSLISATGGGGGSSSGGGASTSTGSGGSGAGGSLSINGSGGGVGYVIGALYAGGSGGAVFGGTGVTLGPVGSVGASGSGYGSGGSGSSANGAGGNGAPGLVILEW